MVLFSIDMRLAMNSTAPAAPIRWPCSAFVELTARSYATSPKTKPDRSLENGLHDASGCAGSHCASTFIALHAAILPGLSSDSEPPAMAMSKYPSRTDRNASPIAIADDAHATE